MKKACSAKNLVNLIKELGRSWRVSWVSGEGWVDRTGSYDESLGQVLLEGCDLGIPHERYLWRVYLGGELGCWLSLVEVLSWHGEDGVSPLRRYPVWSP